MKKIFFLFLVLSSVRLSAQDKKLIDSLNTVLLHHTADTTAVITLNNLGIQYENVSDSTSIWYYHRAEAIAVSTGDLEGQANSFMNLGISLFNKGTTDSSLYYYKKGIAAFKKAKDIRGLSVCYSNYGISLRQIGDLGEAINCLITSQRYAQQVNDEALIANVKLSIGNIYWQKGNPLVAVNYYKEALVGMEKSHNPEKIAMALNNLGLVSSDLKKHDEALAYFFRSMAIRDSIGSLKGVANSMENIAEEYFAMDKIDDAIVYHQKSLAIQKQIKNRKGIATTLINMGAVYTKMKQFNKAIELLNESMAMATAMQHRDMLKSIYEALADNYDKLGNYKSAYEFHKKFTMLKDSIVNEDENKQIAEVNTKYQSEKKDSEIKLLSKDKEIQAADLKKKTLTLWATLAGLFLLCGLLFFIIRNYRIKQKANAEIVKQKLEVEKQKTIIEEKSKEILDSIHYAKRIQGALFASDHLLTKSFPGHFVFYKPKDIVSGDFYWAIKAENTVYLCTADCTGHGVPGAFMSLLGINFLKEIISIKKILSPDRIFNELRDDIISTLNPEGTEVEGKDGMDAVLCAYDFETMEMRFAAANNPIWIIRNGNVIECKPDKQPIGKYFDDHASFTLNTIKLEKNDVVYTFTDGFADQFGGEQGKKFKYKPLQKLLLSIHHLPMTEQYKKLDESFNSWRGLLEQIDDVLIVGVRV